MPRLKLRAALKTGDKVEKTAAAEWWEHWASGK
jgi:hypothetical protein